MKVDLDHIAVILVQPQIPENIGAAARAMNNMGLSRLVLIEPKNCDPCRMLKMATGSSKALIEKIKIYHDLREGLAPYHYLIGTTARTGSLRPTTARPRLLAQRLVSVSQNNLVGILFGPEDRGLSNDQLRHCHTFVTIPTDSFSSLNLAQAVMIICYEIFLGTSERPTEVVPRLANSFELEGMYDHLKRCALEDRIYQSPESGALDRKHPSVPVQVSSQGTGGPDYQGGVQTDRLVHLTGGKT